MKLYFIHTRPWFIFSCTGTTFSDFSIDVFENNSAKFNKSDKNKQLKNKTHEKRTTGVFQANKSFGAYLS